MGDRWPRVHVHGVLDLSARGVQIPFLCISRLNNGTCVRSREDAEVVPLAVGVVDGTALGLVSSTSVKGVLDA